MISLPVDCQTPFAVFTLNSGTRPQIHNFHVLNGKTDLGLTDSRSVFFSLSKIKVMMCSGPQLSVVILVLCCVQHTVMH